MKEFDFDKIVKVTHKHQGQVQKLYKFMVYTFTGTPSLHEVTGDTLVSELITKSQTLDQYYSAEGKKNHQIFFNT